MKIYVAVNDREKASFCVIFKNVEEQRMFRAYYSFIPAEKAKMSRKIIGILR